jgi:hypothetical protein
MAIFANQGLGHFTKAAECAAPEPRGLQSVDAASNFFRRNDDVG